MTIVVRYLPDWLPGTGFKHTANEWRKTLHQFSAQPYEFVKRQIAKGTAKPSYVQAHIDEKQGDLTAEEERDIKWTAASLFTGGADSTVSSLACFFLAMCLFPAVQGVAREELDRVIGTERLPTFEDRPNLPYLNALVKEVLRWHPVTPIGFPHVAVEDDIYE